MLMSIGCEATTSLTVSLTFDDSTTKTRVLGVGDYVTITYNNDGLSKTVTGKISTVYANPYADKVDRSQWYIIVACTECSSGIAKINPMQILDVDIIRKAIPLIAVSTIDSDTNRITHIRVNSNGYFEFSQNDGATWKMLNLAPSASNDGQTITS